eukprot:Colp12_sorted_trinity150504_noHs@4531
MSYYDFSIVPGMVLLPVVLLAFVIFLLFAGYTGNQTAAKKTKQKSKKISKAQQQAPVKVEEPTTTSSETPKKQTKSAEPAASKTAQAKKTVTTQEVKVVEKETSSLDKKDKKVKNKTKKAALAVEPETAPLSDGSAVEFEVEGGDWTQVSYKAKKKQA